MEQFYDMFGRELHINDEVKFFDFNDWETYRGVIASTTPKGMLRIRTNNSEYRRLPKSVVKDRK